MFVRCPFYMPKYVRELAGACSGAWLKSIPTICAPHFAESLFQTRIKQSEGFINVYKENYEDKIYSLNKTVPGQTQDLSQAIQKTLEIMAG